MKDKDIIKWLKQCIVSIGNKKSYTSRAYERCIKALEKQIPKKPMHSGIAYDCPNCLETVGHISKSGKLMSNHHCICGQAIDWSEVDDD